MRSVIYFGIFLKELIEENMREDFVTHRLLFILPLSHYTAKLQRCSFSENLNLSLKDDVCHCSTERNSSHTYSVLNKLGNSLNTVCNKPFIIE